MVLAVLAATSDPTLSQRKRFAERHATKFVFDWDRGRASCVKALAPAALRCDTPVWLCPQSSASGSCSGSFSEAHGITFQLHEPSEAEFDATPLPELTLEEESGDSCAECECAKYGGFGFDEAEQAREQKRCERDAARRQQAERTVRHCTLLLVDPCRQEAFLRCTGRNGDEWDPPLHRTLVFSFAPKPDGGSPQGGEWERAEDE